MSHSLCYSNQLPVNRIYMFQDGNGVIDRDELRQLFSDMFPAFHRLVSIDLLIYKMPMVRNMAPYSCFRAHMSINEVNRGKIRNLQLH